MDRTEIEPSMLVTYKEEYKDSVVWVDGMVEYIGEPFLVLNIDDRDNTALCECGSLMLWLEIDWLELWKGEADGA